MGAPPHVRSRYRTPDPMPSPPGTPSPPGKPPAPRSSIQSTHTLQRDTLLPTNTDSRVLCPKTHHGNFDELADNSLKDEDVDTELLTDE